jgi:hypothetical protein
MNRASPTCYDMENHYDILNTTSATATSTA